ncbi:tripeptidyl peptidase SED3 [Xylona heveae TC161]|uniref:tripeptidyl-peptidase II n=1 Tax=Xylona heveae (strain CBS 132557 / TC161) TaxID=1328760 RepID=A0A164ZGL4_XYLHT|nr:tripeptidyl peptidase SED3 [Xylona heveae TC161]KZF19081.1 tripeptidyl peptidase SED3 [Xylona heveae TC161]
MSYKIRASMRSLSLLAGICSALAGFASVNAAASGPASFPEIFEQLNSVPEGWKAVGVPDTSKRVNFRIAVTQPNPGFFEQTVLDISTPNHPKYGKHLKLEELKALIRPTAEATNAITSWLLEHGVPPNAIHDDGEWINFNATVGQAEKMLDTKFKYYRSNVDGAERIRTLQYSLPQYLHQYIDMIQPTTRFGQIRPQRSWVIDKQILGQAGKGLNVTGCNQTITPACLKELYKIKDFKADPNNGNKLGIAGYLEEYAKFADLGQFLKEYAPYAAGASFKYQQVHGGQWKQNDTVDDDVEANLDIQYGLSLSYPTPNEYYITGGRGLLVPDLDQPDASDDENEPYLDFLNYILSLPEDELPQTLSTSYGEDEQSVPEPYSRTVCSMFGQLGARGVSVIFSSGDTGVGSACQTNDGNKTTRFLPTFPASCPWVTSVGATHYVAPEAGISFSSGGFSDRFPTPGWQKHAVDRYLNILGDQWKGLYNPNGRGIPDVSAQGSHFHVIDQGKEILVGGTSAAAPTFAAVVSLLNSARVSANLPPLGFLNPWIYAFGRYGLTDITHGGSTGCTGKDIYSGLATPYVPYASWNATEGWDPVTGWGTPVFTKLLALSSPFELDFLTFNFTRFV